MISFSEASLARSRGQLSQPIPSAIDGIGDSLFVAGGWADGRHAAVFDGTGWHPLFPTPEQYSSGRRRIEELRADHDRSDPFTFSYSCGVTKLLDSEDGPYVTGSWADLDDVPDDFDYAPPMPADDAGRPFFMGTPDQVAADIDLHRRAGVEHFVLRFATGGPETTPQQMLDQLERFARDVVPRAARESAST